MLLVESELRFLGGNKTASSAASTSSNGSNTSSSDGGGTGTLEPCKLSESDVSAIVGFTVKKQTGSATDCSYTALDTDSDHLGASLTLSVSPFTGGAAGTKTAADAIASAFNTSPVDIPGVGDQSFFIDAGFVGELVVFSGKNEVIVAVGGLDQDTSARKDQLIALAKKLLS